MGMTPKQMAEIMLRCNPLEAVQGVVVAVVAKCDGKPDLATVLLLQALEELRPDAFTVKVED